MALYKTSKVVEIIEQHSDVIKFVVQDGSKVYCFPHINGHVSLGDEVVLNTTAVDLNLGTGGWHFMVWNKNNDHIETPRGGHIMKMRYSPIQLDTGVAEEYDDYPKNESDLDSMPVIAAPLHSHIAPIVTVLKNYNPKLKISLVLSDGAALPIALSDLTRNLKNKGLIDKTITFGHSFGGDIEAINIYTALISAKYLAESDLAIVTMGPGIVGTNSKFGFTGIEVATNLDIAKNLGAKTYGVLRCSQADPRPRHQGVSHHSLTTFSKATLLKHDLGYISDHEMSQKIYEQLESHSIFEKHDVVKLDKINIVEMMENIDLHISSMGRKAREDELFFESAAVAGRRVIEDIS